MQKSIAFIGCGSMGSAILNGMLHHGYKPEDISVTTKSQRSAEALASKYGVTAYASDYQPNANALAAEGADIVLLGVKPLAITQVIDEIKHVLGKSTLVISVAAGITTETMSAHLENNPVIRAMPNTPALIGKGVTGISAGAGVSQADLAEAVSLFETVGKTLVVDETQIDALSTISGSGPAYVFYFIEEFIKTAMEHGFTQEQAYLMVSETFAGASALLTKTQEDPAVLRRNVTSPNGTTMKAIAVLEEGELSKLFTKATSAALARAKEIAQEMK